MFYAASTGGFYSSEIHGDKIPNDSVEISQEEYEELLQGQSSGSSIVADEDGRPTLSTNELSPEEAQAEINAEARAYLENTDWYVIRKGETGEEIPQEILDERAAARGRVVE